MAPLLDLIKKLEKTRKDRYDITDRNLLRYTNQMLEKLDKKIQSFAPKLKFFCTPKKETSEKDIYLEIQAIITKAQKELPLYKKMQELLLLRQKAKEAEEARAPRPSSLTRYY